MAVTSVASGTQAAVIGTEHFVASVNTAGAFVFWVNRKNMVALDTLERRVYKIVKPGGTSDPYLFAAFYGAVPTWDQVLESLAVLNSATDTDAVKFSLLQRYGTGRTFDWAIDKAG
jgi:hypothetical protein